MPSLLRALLSEHLDPGYAAAAEKRRDAAAHASGRERAFGWLWQALAALLIATVFAAAVAQARSVAPGVRSAQQLLLRQRAFDGEAPRPSSPSGAVSCPLESTTCSAARWPTTPKGSGCWPVSMRSGWPAASTAVIGPGLKVTVTDPGASPNLSDVSKQRVSGSRQIILDRDLQLVVNSLWASGAEAISVGGVRIGPNVTIRQAGGAILVDNNPTSSPYTILAVGPPHAMRDVFDQQPRAAAS